MANAAAALKTTILNAFATTPYPGDDNLVVDQTGRDPESREIASAFAGKRWNDVSVDILRKFSQALPLFTPSAFRYYLPAYMMLSINHLQNEDIAKDFVLFNLTPPDNEGGWEDSFFHARANQFNTMERDAIASFMRLMGHDKIADWATEGLKPQLSRIKRAVDFWASEQRD